MIAHGMAPCQYVAHELRIFLRVLGNAKETGFRVMSVEDIEYLWRDVGVGAIVKGQRNRVGHGIRDGYARDNRSKVLAAGADGAGGIDEMMTGHNGQCPGPMRWGD